MLVAIAVGWVGIILAWTGRWVGLVIVGSATLLAFFAIWRGQVLASRESASLQTALTAAGDRNHELEALRHLAQVLLTGHSLPQLLTEVCRFAADLLDAEAAGLG